MAKSCKPRKVLGSSKRGRKANGNTRKFTTRWFVSPIIPKTLKLNFVPRGSTPEIPLSNADSDWQTGLDQITPDSPPILEIQGALDPAEVFTPLSSLERGKVQRRNLFKWKSWNDLSVLPDSVFVNSETPLEPRQLPMESGISPMDISMLESNDTIFEEELSDGRPEDFDRLRVKRIIFDVIEESFSTPHSDKCIVVPAPGASSSEAVAIREYFVPETPQNQ
ncbi:uncharacterized protein LOC100906565 [Galendromus occidentalis]|uniref:Uncharacterized protein LOC100906565 n=1 Tax=Galendromus occidentalis TaxID=34638 RepID=A0AAJ6QWU3_9ACAR|nr:uncharacterized protein LOC100906565 [Galendromus occidentalis]